MSGNDRKLLLSTVFCALSLHAGEAWGEQSDPNGTASDASYATKQAHNGQTSLSHRHLL